MNYVAEGIIEAVVFIAIACVILFVIFWIVVGSFAVIAGMCITIAGWFSQMWSDVTEEIRISWCEMMRKFKRV